MLPVVVLSFVLANDRIVGREAVLGVVDLPRQPVHSHALLRGSFIAAHLQGDVLSVTVLHAQCWLKDLSLGSRSSHACLKETDKQNRAVERGAGFRGARFLGLADLRRLSCCLVSPLYGRSLLVCGFTECGTANPAPFPHSGTLLPAGPGPRDCGAPCLWK